MRTVCSSGRLSGGGEVFAPRGGLLQEEGCLLRGVWYPHNHARPRVARHTPVKT